MPVPNPPRIGVIGGNRLSPDDYGDAVEVGRLLARAGAVVYCGGMAGAMEAVCKGVAQEGGTSVGILPGDDPAAANPHVKVPVATGMGYARNYIIVHSSEALIAIGGSEGTLNEMAAALNLGRTVVCLRSWEVDRLGRMERGRIAHAMSPDEAVRAALEAAASRRA
ncbi:MAG TPA: TIGR00725 family protein [Candidatus Thermoplasmatota archaeon]